MIEHSGVSVVQGRRVTSHFPGVHLGDKNPFLQRGRLLLPKDSSRSSFSSIWVEGKLRKVIGALGDGEVQTYCVVAWEFWYLTPVVQIFDISGTEFHILQNLSV